MAATGGAEDESTAPTTLEAIVAEFNLPREAAGFVSDWRSTPDWSERNRLLRKRLDHLLHTRAFQILVIGLVLLDAVIVVAELAIDLGILEASGKAGLKSSVWPHLLHSVSLAILSFFLLETGLKLYGMGLRILSHKMELFDMFVIVISFALDVASAVPGSTLTALFALVVLLRLWRVVRIVNSIALSIRLQGRKALAKQSELRKQAEGKCADLEGKVARLEAGLQEALDLIEGKADFVTRLSALLPNPKPLTAITSFVTSSNNESPAQVTSSYNESPMQVMPPSATEYQV